VRCRATPGRTSVRRSVRGVLHRRVWKRYRTTGRLRLAREGKTGARANVLCFFPGLALSISLSLQKHGPILEINLAKPPYGLKIQKFYSPGLVPRPSFLSLQSFLREARAES